MANHDGLPTLEMLQAERMRLQHRRRYRRALFSTLAVLAVVAAAAVLVSTILLPVFRITGTSMEPNLNDGDIIVAMKTDHFQRGQVCGFYFNNKLLLKRVIATAGMWVEIDDLEYPVQVPDGCVFVLGDHRSTSVDSRSSVLGFIQESETVGQIVLRVWPLEDFGLIE